MAICLSGMDQLIASMPITISITTNHPLIHLASIIPWKQLKTLVLPDLKKTTKKGCWWLERKLKLRIHLDIYLLQQFYNKTDRQMEYDLKDNAAYQLFCGLSIVDHFHCPDHFVTDRGYFSNDNEALLSSMTLKKFRLPKPGVPNKPPSTSDPPEIKKQWTIQQKLNRREVGIEPLIGHMKHRGQLGKSRMKTDYSTLASGYAAVLSFNLRQLMRHQQQMILNPV